MKTVEFKVDSKGVRFRYYFRRAWSPVKSSAHVDALVREARRRNWVAELDGQALARVRAGAHDPICVALLMGVHDINAYEMNRRAQLGL